MNKQLSILSQKKKKNNKLNKYNAGFNQGDQVLGTIQ